MDGNRFLPPYLQSGDDDEGEVIPFKAMTEDEFLAKQSGRVHLVDGLLGFNELTVAWGPPKQGGKTAFWLRLARRVSQRLPVFGRAIGTDLPHGSLYVALENPAEVRDRVAALRLVDGPAPNFRVRTKPLNLRSRSEALGLASYIDGEGMGLVVLDILRRVLGGGDLNNGVDVGYVLDNLRLLQSETTAHIALLSHGTIAGQGGGGPRGCLDQVGDADTLIRHAMRADGTRTATVVEARGDPAGLVLRYRPQQIELPAEAHTPARSAIIAEEMELAAVSRGGRRRAGYAELALDRLRASKGTVEGRVLVDDWRAAFYDALPALTGTNRRVQFQRARVALMAGGDVAISEGFAWPTGAQNP